MTKTVKALALFLGVTMISTGIASTSLAEGRREAGKARSARTEHSRNQKAESERRGGPRPLQTWTPTSTLTLTPLSKMTSTPTTSPTPTASKKPAPTPAPTAAAAANGASLYNSICANCHGTSKMNSPAATIQNAINTNIGGMGSYSYLTPAQISAIAAY